MRNTVHSSFNPFLKLNRNKNLKSNIAVLMALVMINLNLSCRYYKVNRVTTTPDSMGKTIDDFNKMGKYAIINSGMNSYNLSSVVVNIDSHNISGTITSLSSEHIYKNARKDKANKYKKNKQKPMDEVHFQLKEQHSFSVGDEVSIPFSDIASISLNKTDGGTELATFLLGTIGVIGGIFLIAVALKSSCPFVYIKNGEKYTFVGDLYPGVITKNIQRDDYLPLPKFQSIDNEYILKITNELKEIQYTDFIELITVDHEKGSKVLLDKIGNIQTFSKLESPYNVILDNGDNNINPVLNKDLDYYKFNTSNNNLSNVSHLILEFNKTETSKKGKLYLTVKNSMWLDFVYGKFNEQFGSYFNTFQKDLQNDPAEKSVEWANNQNIPLSVYIETENGWELVDRINAVGPLAQRDVVIPLELNETTQNNLRVKLETGFMFWELDYAAIDFSQNLPVNISYLSPNTAIDDRGNDVSDLLAKKDDRYLIQKEIGNEVVVSFLSTDQDQSMEQDQSVFLKNKGYYMYIRDYSGTPDADLLKSFEENGSFTQFAVDKFYELIEAEQILTDKSMQ